ncbi:MAG: arginine--tRNA ligase [Acidimicrobiia bacterium]|nr:arginine--tRNA ligase [Acidimicrobiia bacterium]
MSIQGHLSHIVGEIFEDLGLPPGLGEVLPSQRPELAQFQCNGAMAAAKIAGRPPREIASEVAERLAKLDEIEFADIAGPGFVNLSLTAESLAEWSNRTAAHDQLGYELREPTRTVLVDYAGPNVAKAMHVGHLRATIIGDALARLFAFAGHQVIRDPHFGDWGFQMGLLIAVVKEQGIDPKSITLDDLQTIYPEASQRAESDPDFADRARQETVLLQSNDPQNLDIWRQMKAVSEKSQREDFTALGVEFDLWYGESDVHDRLAPLVDQLRESGAAEESEGALVVRVDKPEDNREWPPLILLSSAGGFLYSTTDMATLQMRVDDLGADLILYVVDRRQSDHFTQLFRAARKSGIVPQGVDLEHISYGTMNGPDGRPFKTRAGGVVQLGDVIAMIRRAARERLDEAKLAEEYPDQERTAIADQVGLATLKFGDLINNRNSDYVFDLDRFSSFEGKTGPYLQYQAVRIKSILRKAYDRGAEPGDIIPASDQSELDLVLELLRSPEAIERALELRSPNHVAEHAYNVAARFSTFYDRCHILSEEDHARQSSWLGISAWALETLETLLDQLGITVPDRM